MKLLFMTNVPSPYRVDFFNELGKYCELTVLFEKNTSDERDASWKQHNFRNFQGIVMKGKSLGVDVAFCPEVIKYLKKDRYDHIICTGFNSPTTMLAITWLRLRGIPYYLESDGGFAKSGKGFKESVKRHFIRGAKGYFSTAKANDEYYLCYGATQDKLIRYPFSSVHDADVLPELPADDKKKQLRDKLGMQEEKIALYVGRMLDLKGVDILLHAAKDLAPQIGLYMVGGEPSEAYRMILEQYDLGHVHFRSFQTKEGLSDYYQAADVFVMPTRGDVWGLVLNEAMAKGLPVISTDRCIAALEMVKDRQTGVVVPVEDADALAGAINRLLEDPALLREYSKNALALSGEYTIETMAQKHINIFA